MKMAVYSIIIHLPCCLHIILLLCRCVYLLKQMFTEGPSCRDIGLDAGVMVVEYHKVLSIIIVNNQREVRE